MPFGHANVLSHLFAIPYVLLAEAVFLHAERFYIKLDGRIVGVLVLRNKPDHLDVASLGVAAENRRSGVATCALRFTEEAAARLGKKQIQLSVLKRNLPAQRLYFGFGFSVAKTTRWSLIMRKAVNASFRKS
ncbi:MAG TPA: GNAT family N-acetyltransferase [Candidatus Eisenbacteria bacterium]|nr:GNAT family N-acetyltransferase [Candidatus Eisenbacteria bacterium]